MFGLMSRETNKFLKVARYYQRLYHAKVEYDGKRDEFVILSGHQEFRFASDGVIPAFTSAADHNAWMSEFLFDCYKPQFAEQCMNFCGEFITASVPDCELESVDNENGTLAILLYGFPGILQIPVTEALYRSELKTQRQFLQRQTIKAIEDCRQSLRDTVSGLIREVASYMNVPIIRHGLGGENLYVVDPEKKRPRFLGVADFAKDLLERRVLLDADPAVQIQRELQALVMEENTHGAHVAEK